MGFKRGGYPMSLSSMPVTQPRDSTPLRCDRACCWTPFGHKVDAKNCNCHGTKESIYS